MTRLRHGETFYLNPDLFERVDTHVDTTIRLTDGTEYIVVEPGEEIVRRIAEFRARVLAMAAVLQSSAFTNRSWERPPAEADAPDADGPAPAAALGRPPSDAPTEERRRS